MNDTTTTTNPDTDTNTIPTADVRPTLVLGGTGKTGRRVAERLSARGRPVRIGSRSAMPPFDWEDPAGWDAALDGVGAVYVAFQPDLAVPGSDAAIEALTRRAVAHGVDRLVLLSGRGEPEAEVCEDVVRRAGVDWTIVRASWFMQNFDESYFVDMLRQGEVALPVGPVAEPFVDAGDIADVAVAALTEPGHAGELYEVTGPRLLTFEEAVGEIAAAAGHAIRYVEIPTDAFVEGLRGEGLPGEIVDLLTYLFTTVLDGRNASLADGVRRALGRPPRDFADFTARAAAAGVWYTE